METSGLAGPKNLRNLLITSPRCDFFDYVVHNIFNDFLRDENFNIENIATIKDTLISTYDNINKRYLRIFLLSDNPVFIWLCMADLREFTLAFDRYFHKIFPELSGQPFLKSLPDWITSYIAHTAVGLEALVSQIPRPISGRSKQSGAANKAGKHIREVSAIFGFTKASVSNLQKAREEVLKMTIVFMAYKKGLNNAETAELLYRFRYPQHEIEGQPYIHPSGSKYTREDMRVVNKERKLLGIDR
jgi:hypothetical protein